MAEEKINLKKLQGSKTKQKIYECARQLFSTRHYSTVSVEDITRAAGVSKGTFFVHFPSKDALIATLIADNTTDIDLDYKNFLDSLPPDLPTSKKMVALGEKIASVISDTIGHDTMMAIYQIHLSKTVPLDAVMGYGRRLYIMFREILEQGIHQGEFHTDMPLDLLSRHFVMGMRGICYEWCVRYPDFDLKEQIVAHIKLLLKGMIA